MMSTSGLPLPLAGLCGKSRQVAGLDKAVGESARGKSIVARRAATCRDVGTV